MFKQSFPISCFTECSPRCLPRVSQSVGFADDVSTSIRSRIPDIYCLLHHCKPLKIPNIWFSQAQYQNPHAILADLASMLLSNLTAATPACATLLILKVKVIPDSRLSNGVFPVDSRCGSCPEPVPYPRAEPRDVAALPLLINAFVEGAQVVQDGDLSKRTRKANLHFMASVFANMTAASPFACLRQSNNLQYNSRLLPGITSCLHNLAMCSKKTP